jgi:hypothetical protein
MYIKIAYNRSDTVRNGRIWYTVGYGRYGSGTVAVRQRYGSGTAAVRQRYGSGTAAERLRLSARIGRITV